jgi:hypothetical protein
VRLGFTVSWRCSSQYSFGENPPLPAALVDRGIGQKLAYFYFEEEAGRRIGRQVAHERIATNLAKPPLLRKS